MAALNSNQLKFLEVYMANPLLTMKEVAESIGIKPKTVYDWKYENTNGFRDELEARLANKWEEAKYQASEGMMNLALKGDFKALKYILDYNGYTPVEKQEVKLDTTNINVTIGD